VFFYKKQNNNKDNFIIVAEVWVWVFTLHSILLFKNSGRENKSNTCILSLKMIRTVNFYMSVTT
jgi:hypothetical protein